MVPHDYSLLTVKRLIEICRDRNIKYSGLRKNELIEKLELWDRHYSLSTSNEIVPVVTTIQPVVSHPTAKPSIVTPTLILKPTVPLNVPLIPTKPGFILPSFPLSSPFSLPMLPPTTLPTISTLPKNRYDFRLTSVEEGLYEYVIPPDTKNIENIIGFDLDDTLLKRFTSELMFPNLSQILNSYRNSNYLVIYTNQKGISQGKTTIEEVENRLNSLYLKCGFKISVYVSTTDNNFRKPNPDMFIRSVKDYLWGKRKFNFLYVGDAAGRIGDFNDSDINFLYNINIWAKYNIPFPKETWYSDTGHGGTSSSVLIPYSNIVNHGKIEFTTPESLWKGLFSTTKKEIYSTKSAYTNLNLESYIVSENKYNDDLNFITSTINTQPFCIFMVGYPACGKSTLSNRLIEIFNSRLKKGEGKGRETVRISRDDFGGNLSKTKKAFTASLGKNIILDNTNLSIEHRDEFKNLLSNDYKIFAVLCIADSEKWTICLHLNHMRAYQAKTKPIPMIAYYTARKKYSPILESERFDTVFDWGSKYVLTGTPRDGEFFYHYDI